MHIMARVTKTRIDRISDPAQRAVARRIGEILDIFSERFAALPPAERLVDTGPAEDDAGRVRNLVRMMALGGVVRLGVDLGLSTLALHGLGKGRTKVEELTGFHRTTVLNAMTLFNAILSDRGEFGLLVSRRYAAILKSAIAEVKATREDEAA